MAARPDPCPRRASKERRGQDRAAISATSRTRCSGSARAAPTGPAAQRAAYPCEPVNLFYCLAPVLSRFLN